VRVGGHPTLYRGDCPSCGAQLEGVSVKSVVERTEAHCQEQHPDARPGDSELLTDDRCWLAVDLRDPVRRALQEQNRSSRARIGRKRRLGDRLGTLSDEELAAYVVEPLHHDLEQRPPAPDLSVDLL